MLAGARIDYQLPSKDLAIIRLIGVHALQRCQIYLSASILIAEGIGFGFGFVKLCFLTLCNILN